MTAAKRRASTGTTNSAAVEQQQYQLHPQQEQQHHQQHQQIYQHVQTYQYTGQHNNRNNQQNHQHHHFQHSNRQQHQNRQHYQKLRDCSVKLPLDILWLPKSAMRPAGPEASHTDCILVVGVSRPKLAVVFLTVMLISLFLTFHVLYDSAVYNIQAAQQSVTTRQRLALLSAAAAAGNRLPEFIKPAGTGAGGGGGGGVGVGDGVGLVRGFGGGGGVANTGSLSVVTSSNQISHPMVFPSNRVHFPKTSRRLPQALIIGIRKCGTRALLEMLYLHPRIQKAGGEVHFFDRDENYMRGLEWYRKKMPHSFRGQITIEKSPSYFVSPEVWADQKKYVRHKAAQNVKASKATGGGPNQEQKFSATEEAIYHLIGMKESVEGVAKTFGLPSSNVQMAEQENVNPMLEDEILNAAFEENDDVTPYQPRAKKPKLDRIKIPTQARSSADILVEELSIQKGISETLKDQLQNSKKIYRSIDRLHDLFKGHFQDIENIKKNEEQELKRHNLVMENLKLKEVEDKIERNRRQLEIEELKHNSAY